VRRARHRVAVGASVVALLALAVGGCGPKPIHRVASEPDVHATTGALETAARPWLGTGYRYGGQDAEGIDCSAFAQEMLRPFGVELPRTVKAQRGCGKPVMLEAIRPGDLVFFRLESSRVNHVGIVLDPRRFVHASRSRGVVVDQLDNDYFRRRLVEVRRVLERQ
jgi:cell wall-associated NlpC family hydrolase